jgi:hypothetical protein
MTHTQMAAVCHDPGSFALPNWVMTHRLQTTPKARQDKARQANRLSARAKTHTHTKPQPNMRADHSLCTTMLMHAAPTVLHTLSLSGSGAEISPAQGHTGGVRLAALAPAAAPACS